MTRHSGDPPQKWPTLFSEQKECQKTSKKWQKGPIYYPINSDFFLVFADFYKMMVVEGTCTDMCISGIPRNGGVPWKLCICAHCVRFCGYPMVYIYFFYFFFIFFYFFLLFYSIHEKRPKLVFCIFFYFFLFFYSFIINFDCMWMYWWCIWTVHE